MKIITQDRGKRRDTLKR